VRSWSDASRHLRRERHIVVAIIVPIVVDDDWDNDQDDDRDGTFASFCLKTVLHSVFPGEP